MEENTINSSVEDENEGEDTDTEDTDTEDDTATNTTSDTSDAFNNVDKKDAESRFSMYALDKYATAFDAPSGSNVIGTAKCRMHHARQIL